ncbi:hypothetical protein AS156_37675 [Bradyrhizobium macuxiense]|uniref:Uncharacterized protein n=1 Tax=Bradyrhizobium macuxiense TaxID=1755647 RepID=A0A109JZI7_9BRAD|nr:hypothetical protein [Bradyrhizobium macuxiense]KWV57928.1 hypothetical protein AS156_37675 [Bradyrhizobium macuxiense]
MTIKASGRLALMVATGFLVCAVGQLPARAAGSDTTALKSDSASADTSVRHSKHAAHRKSSKTADKSESQKTAGSKVGDAGSVTSAGIPASVANANAELTSGDTANAAPAAATNSTLAAADKPVDAQQPADSSVVASDQLNDVDRTLQQAQPVEPQQPAQQQQAAQPETPPAQPQTPATASSRAAPVLASGESSTWDQTSLIGKIFIGFGALLTVASAARMFMA